MDLQKGGRISRTGGITGHEHNLNEMTDVAVDGVSDGSFLRYTNNMWIPEKIARTDIADEPVGASGPTQTSVQTTTAWGRTVMTLDITLTRSALCLVMYSAFLRITGNATTGLGDIRVSVEGSGATTWSADALTTPATGPESYAYGQVLYTTSNENFSQTTSTAHQRSGYQLRYLNAGTTTFTMKSYNFTTLPAASSVDYPSLHVIPLR